MSICLETTLLAANQSQKLVQCSDDLSKIKWVIRTSTLQARSTNRQRSLQTDAITLEVPTASGDKEMVLVRMQAYVTECGTLRWSVCLPENSFGCLALWVGPKNLKLRISQSAWTTANLFLCGRKPFWSVADHTEEDQIELNMQIRLYTPPRGLPECPGRFNLKRILGKGGFGEVWEVEDTETGSTDFVAKLSSKPGYNDISVEAQALRMLASSTEGGRLPGFPQVMAAYKHDDGRDMMIVQRLKRTLWNISLDKELVTLRKFSPSTVIEVGLQLIDRIQQMHKMGFVHRDIKAENIMISEENEDVIYLIDHGLAKPFCVEDETGNFLHIAQFKNEDEDVQCLTGTALLASRDAHIGPVSRRGDIQNLIFVLMKMALPAGRLPWSDVREAGLAGQVQMLKRKNDLEEIRLFTKTWLNTVEGLQLGTSLVKMLEHSIQLAFDETPDYCMLRSLLIQCLPELAPPPAGMDRDATNESNVSTARGKLQWNQGSPTTSNHLAVEALDRLTRPNLALISESSPKSASIGRLESAGTTASPNTLATGSGPSSRHCSGAEYEAQVAAKLCKLLVKTKPLALHETIYEFHKEALIENIADLNLLAECTFNTIMEPEHDPELTGSESRYAQLGETLSEILVLLRFQLPQFCSCGKRLGKHSRCCLRAEEKPVAFTRILLNCVQRRFETLMKQFSEAEQLRVVTKELEHSLTACVTFIGRLYVRKLVAARVVAQVVAETIGVSERQPHPGCIRCVCELIYVIGHFMEDSKPGEALMGQFFTRIDNLGALRNSGTNTPIYEQNIRDIITDMHQARFLKWPPPCANRVPLQFFVTDVPTAFEDWKELQKRKAVPPSEMQSDFPPGLSETGEHVLIKSMLSGRTIAVAFSQDVAGLTGETFAELISELVGIRSQRIMLFTPDGTLVV